MNAKVFGNFTEPFIPCPQKRGRTDQDRGYEVSVYDSDAEAVQASGLDQRPYFIQLRHSHLRQRIEQRQRLATVPQRSQRKFGSHKRMDHNPALVEMLAHLQDSGTQMVNPNRRIRENQRELALRRGIRLSSGIVPPRDASLRPLS